MNLKEDKISSLISSICRQRIYVENNRFGKKKHGSNLAANASRILDQLGMLTNHGQVYNYAKINISLISDICINSSKSNTLSSLINELKITNMLKIIEKKQGLNDYRIMFQFKLGEHIHFSEFSHEDNSHCEYYIRDCAQTIISHALFQLTKDIYSKINEKTSFDVKQKIARLDLYAKALLPKGYEETAKFIYNNRNIILYLIPEGEKELLNTAHTIINFSEIIVKTINEKKLLISTLC